MQVPDDKWHNAGHSALTYDKDRTISQIAEGLSQCIIEFTHRRKIFPEGYVNSTYFAQAVIRAWLYENPNVKICASVFPLDCDPICGINWPKPDLVRSRISKRLVGLIEAESQPHGQGLDVAFAVAVVEELFDENGILRAAYEDKRPEIGLSEEEQHRIWLSGFFSRGSDYL